MADRLRIPGPRDVVATRSDPATSAERPDARADAVVVECPPHPQFGGSRVDRRLRAVGDALGERGVASLRFDYGPWAEGAGEVGDAERALAWARDEYGAVGLFGYSFGGAVALLAAADAAEPPAALSLLSPPATLGDDLDPVAAIDRIDCPLQVVYGERDETVDSTPVVERARAAGHEVTGLTADHHFVGQEATVGETVAAFLGPHLGTG